MPRIELKNVSKVFSIPLGKAAKWGSSDVIKKDTKVNAVKNFNLTIEEGEFIVLVGPSGCGKTTVLRMIAGLEYITNGEIYIDDQIVNDIAPKDRNIAMVFQSYALYPHATVYKNIAMGLMFRKFPRKEIKKRVLETAKSLGIDHLLKRKPKQLSGGERQRVALGRALVQSKPFAFLFDEPLSNLDANLRVSTRVEISLLHKKLKTTFIYVTHDQVEAMTMGDRIVVMRDGYIQQVGEPQEIYSKPVNMFVAGFIGSPQMNFIPMILKKDDIGYFTQKPVPGTGDMIKLKIPDDKLKNIHPEEYLNKEIIIGIRPENVLISDIAKDEDSLNSIHADVMMTEELGSEKIVYTKMGEVSITARVPSDLFIEKWAHNEVIIDINNIYLFDKDTERVLT